MTHCKFHVIKYDDKANTDLTDFEEIHQCKLCFYLFFKERSHITYPCDTKGSIEDCEVLKMCREL